MKKQTSMAAVSCGRIQKGASIPSDKGKMTPINMTSATMYKSATGDGVKKNLGKGHK